MKPTIQNNNKEIHFSIIIPAKNEEAFITSCLSGINKLNYDSQRVEIWVVDNESNDSTSYIAKKMGAKVIQSKGTSIASLRNYGARKANGIVLGFVDADCIVDKDWLNVAIRHFSNDEKICAIGAPEMPPHDQSTWVEKTWTALKHGPTPPDGFAYTSWCASGAMLIKREVFEKIGGFDDNLSTCEDADLSNRVAKHGNIILDHTIPFQHLRGSQTLLELFRREMWRGKNNITGFFVHGASFRELPSVLAPLLFIFSFLCASVALLISFWLNNSGFVYLTVFFIFIFFLIPYLMILKKIGLSSSFKDVSQSYIICFVYLLARGLASVFPTGRTW